MHRITHRFGDREGDFPVGQAVFRLHHLADALNASLGIDEGPVFLEKCRAGQEHMRIMRGFAQKEILYHHAFHRL